MPRTLRRLLHHRLFVIGAVVFTLVVLVAIFANAIATHSITKMDVHSRMRPPSARFLFGTDAFGRDLFSRTVVGSRISIEVGVMVALTTGALGTLIGAASGYFRWLDNVLMRIVDALMAFPALLLALGVAAALGPSALNAVIALSIAYVPRTARIVRGSVMVVRSMLYVDASRVAGAGHLRVICRHILPNCLAPLIVQITFIFGYAILAEAILSYLGLGTPPPTPSWGNIIADGRDFIIDAPWITIFPGLCISITVLSLNLMGDGLRDVLDPRQTLA
jgi:peptide/nickel transport system permease protein